jgi:hypothetical protein
MTHSENAISNGFSTRADAIPVPLPPLPQAITPPATQTCHPTSL